MWKLLKHRRFTEFCDACRRYGYIGLCYEKRMEGDLKAARELQRVLLPDTELEIEGMEGAVRLAVQQQLGLRFVTKKLPFDVVCGRGRGSGTN